MRAPAGFDGIVPDPAKDNVVAIAAENPVIAVFA